MEELIGDVGFFKKAHGTLVQGPENPAPEVGVVPAPQEKLVHTARHSLPLLLPTEPLWPFDQAVSKGGVRIHWLNEKLFRSLGLFLIASDNKCA
jgi:hypothetical protein